MQAVATFIIEALWALSQGHPDSIMLEALSPETARIGALPQPPSQIVFLYSTSIPAVDIADQVATRERLLGMPTVP